jgi:hypothetical protein
LLTTCGGWRPPNTANAFDVVNALAGLWISNKKQHWRKRGKIPALLALSSGHEIVLPRRAADINRARVLRFLSPFGKKQK